MRDTNFIRITFKPHTIKFEPYIDRLYIETRRIHNTKAEKTKKSRQQWSKEADFPGATARVGHAPPP
jgi:hypothetical protein